MKKFIATIIGALLLSSNCLAQKYLGELAETEFNLSKKELGFAVNIFEVKSNTIDFLGIQKGDIIAEIGTGDCINIGILSTLFDNVTFYAQDIDAKTLTQKKLNKKSAYYLKRKHAK
ncbi:MAG TPA: hypothetical protein VN698_16140, partial [Bacteroidia bacterium]|nr:hypothetical protein [Bacteroidia bacterium]